MKKNVYLKYIGNGASLSGVPAQDLDRDEVVQYGEAALLASGLYVKVEPMSNKMSMGPKSNKSLKDDDKE